MSLTPNEKAYIRALFRKRDEYLRARDEEFIVPESHGCFRNGERFVVWQDADGAQHSMRESEWEAQKFIRNLTNEWRPKP